MPATFEIFDETTGGGRRGAGTFACESAATTVREIIRFRVQQEVERFNQSDAEVFQGILQPGETERILNGERPSYRFLDWETQYDKTVRAFQSNGFLVLIDD